MEEERFMLSNFDEIPQLCQSFQADKYGDKRSLNIPETIPEQSAAHLHEGSLKLNDPGASNRYFSSENKENIASNNSVISDESTVCAMMSFNFPNVVKCEKLLESSSVKEKSFQLEKMAVNDGKLSKLSKTLKFLDETISTPPSVLREQISLLRKEMNEAYEFHDLETQILNEERKGDPEGYAELFEKYSTLLELYTSLKNEYEEYRKDQEKMRDELQSKTVDCLESLCSQIETSDNSLSSASFISFNTDFKSSTMIGNLTEKEMTLLHDVTIQTKDPLSNTDVFKTPKLTPSKSTKKFFPQNLNEKHERYDSDYNVKLMEVENLLSDKIRDVEKLEQRLFKVQDFSELLQTEFERISSVLLKENKTLKENLLNKSEQLDTLTQKLFTEIISLNPKLVDSLTDAPGTKLLPVFIETIMEGCKNIQDELIMKFNSEKCELENRVNNLEKINETLNEQISSQVSVIQELKNSYEKELLETKNTILTRDEEIRTLKIHDSSTRQMREDLALAKERVIQLEAQLSSADNQKKEMEDKCRILEQTRDSLQFDLEKIKKLCETIQVENDKLKEGMSEIQAKNRNLQDICERLTREVSENEEVISSQKKEILHLKNHEMKQMKVDLAQADEIILKMKTELLAAEGEKLKFEERCSELENANATLQTVIITKDTILKDLERFKESEWKYQKQEIKEKEALISDLRMELDTVEQKYFVESKKLESLNEEMNFQTTAFEELEKSFKDIENQLLEAESKIQMQDERIRILLSRDADIRQTQDDLASAKEMIKVLEARLLATGTDKKEIEDRYQALEKKNNSLLVDLERMKSQFTSIELENENFKKLIDENHAEFNFDSLFEIFKEGKKTLAALLTSDLETENLAFKLIAERISNLPDVLKLIENMVEYFNMEWEAKQTVLIENLQNEIKITSEQLSDITSENRNLQEMCEQLKTDLTETEGIVSLRDQEILNFRNQAAISENLKAELESASEKIIKLNDQLFQLKSLEAAIASKDIILKDVENWKSFYEHECELAKSLLKEKEEVILSLQNELFSVRESWNENVRKMEDEKLELKNRCIELENKNANLLSLITTKDLMLKDLEIFKSFHEKKDEDIKREVKEKEEIISHLKAELNTFKEKFKEDIQKTEVDKILKYLQLSCEKLKDILGSDKFIDMQNDELLELIEQLKSRNNDTEGRVITQFMSAVFDIRKNILQQWEKEKNNNCRLIKELKDEMLNLQRREASFENLKQRYDNLLEKFSEEEVSIEELAGLEKTKLSSVKEFPKIMKKVMVYVKKLQSRAAELKEENEKLDEECDSYAKVIKDLKKEAAIEWKRNNEKMQVLEREISRLTETKNDLENEKEELLGKMSNLEDECQKLRTAITSEGTGRNCGCGVDLKKVNELKRTILVKEQKLLELQDMEAQNISFKSQIEYLKHALEKERKKISEEKEKIKKLQSELNEATQNQKTDNKKFEENQILEELRMRGSISGGVVQEIVDKEKMRKLSKDVGVLKEICRARYAEIKRLEAENAALKNITPKNSNQLDSPIRSRGYVTRSKSAVVDKWKSEMGGKENKAA